MQLYLPFYSVSLLIWWINCFFFFLCSKAFESAFASCCPVLYILSLFFPPFLSDTAGGRTGWLSWSDAFYEMQSQMKCELLLLLLKSAVAISCGRASSTGRAVREYFRLESDSSLLFTVQILGVSSVTEEGTLQRMNYFDFILSQKVWNYTIKMWLFSFKSLEQSD